MAIISVYNNKGGEGKSTVTVGLAEFLAARKDQKVLVIDLDAQASSSCALLGQETLRDAVPGGQTVSQLISEIRRKRRPVAKLDRFMIWRPATNAKNSALSEIAVMVPDGSRMFDIEDSLNWKKDHSLFQKYLRPALAEFDYVLLDLPANVSKGTLISINGLVMSDFVVIPVRPTRISLSGLPRTFETIDYAQTRTGDGRPAVLGLIRNATDRRYQQYKANFPKIESASSAREMPPVFDNLWPPSPAMESATDANRACETLKDRFGKSYDHARKVARELERRCADFDVSEMNSPRLSLWERLGLA